MTISQLPADVEGAELVWNHETHQVVIDGAAPAELFTFADGTPALASITVAVGRDGVWVCPACAVALSADICPCLCPDPTDDPF